MADEKELSLRIRSLRGSVREEIVSILSEIIIKYGLHDDPSKMHRAFELLKTSVFTFREDDPESELFRFLG